MVAMTADNKDAQEGTACGDDRALTDVEQGELYNFCLPDRRTYVLLRRLVKYGVAPEIAPFGESATGGDDRALVAKLKGGHRTPCPIDCLDCEAAAAIERLTAERDALKVRIGPTLDGVPLIFDDPDTKYVLVEGNALLALQADLSRAREALQEYGQHYQACLTTIGGKCDCGYDAALKGEA